MEALKLPRFPSSYAGTSLLSYSTQWKEHLRRSSSSSNNNKNDSTTATTVFGLAFFSEPIASNANRHWLFGCTADGEICVWKLLGDDPHATNNNDEDDEFSFSLQPRRFSAQNTSLSSRPVVRLKVSKGVLYACKMVERPDAHWLVVSGDDGVMILDWETEILPKIQKQQKKHLNETCLQQHAVRRQFKPYPSAMEASVEVNEFVLLRGGNFLYGAAGDAFGCYKWDLETEKVVTTYKSSKRGGYLHTVDQVPNSNLLLTGGEDGILGVWDTATDKFVDAMDVNEAAAATTNTIAGAAVQPGQQKHRRTVPGSGDNNNSAGSRWISSCKARDENWWTVAGGNNNKNSNAGGFISTWHGPTRTLISTVETRETAQQLAFYSGGTGGTNTLLSVANESFVSHWKNPLSLGDPMAPPLRVWCNQPSAYAVAVSPDGRRFATGGVGSLVDIFDEGTQYGMQLSTH